jgi:hypothetical protein
MSHPALPAPRGRLLRRYSTSGREPLVPLWATHPQSTRVTNKAKTVRQVPHELPAVMTNLLWVYRNAKCSRVPITLVGFRGPGGQPALV